MNQTIQEISSSATIIETNEIEESATTVTLIPPETGAMPRVSWRADTVDNEFLGKHKSKCCCIYKKPKRWSDESDSDSDCETSHCRGHVEKRCGRHDGGAGDSDGRGQGCVA